MATASTKAAMTVAPHAGAWIETLQAPGAGTATLVAPHAGAWIETDQPQRARQPARPVAPYAGSCI